MSAPKGSTEGPRGIPSHTVQTGKEVAKYDPVTKLPFEVFSKIVSYLTPGEARVASAVSKVWNNWTTSALRSTQLADMRKFLTVVATTLKEYPQVVQKCLSLIKPNDVLKTISLLSLKQNFLSLRDYLVETLESVSNEGLLALGKALESIRKPMGLENIPKIAIAYKELNEEKAKPVREEKITTLTRIASTLIDCGAFNLGIRAITLIPEEDSRKKLFREILVKLESRPTPYLRNLSEILELIPQNYQRYFTDQIERLRRFSAVDYIVHTLTKIHPPFERITNRVTAFTEIINELREISDVNKALEIAMAIPFGNQIKIEAFNVVLDKLTQSPNSDKALKIAEELLLEYPGDLDDCMPKILQILELSTNDKNELFTKIECIKDDRLRIKMLFAFLNKTSTEEGLDRFFSFFNKASFANVPPEVKDEFLVRIFYDLVLDGNIDQTELFLERLFSTTKSPSERDFESKFYEKVVEVAGMGRGVAGVPVPKSSKILNLGLFLFKKGEMELATKVAEWIEDPGMKSELLNKIRLR